MSAITNPWGATVTASATPIKLHDVMDEELAAKLQREEEEEWEREIEAQFGDRNGVGWCFVEVPSTDSSEFGVMSVVQQEVPMEEQTSDPNDPDYAFALELQAQEAEEYDRLRRQEASSIERIQVMQQEPPKPLHPQRDFRGFGANRSRRSLLQYQTAVSSADFAVHIEEGFEYESDKNDGHDRHVGDEYHASGYAHHHDDDGEVDEEDMFLEDDLPIKNFHTLEITRRGGERKHYHRAPSSSSSSSSSTSSSQQHHPGRA